MNPVEASKAWIEQVVIAQNFCPFAKKEYDLGRVHFVLSETSEVEAGLETLIKECERLDENIDIETTLIIYSNLCADFEDFLGFIEMANQLMQMQGYEGVYQLASFHPDYCFEGEEKNDAANYTNRSPWPMLHLIREESLEKVLESYPEPEMIPENNINLARKKGPEYFEKILTQIKEDES